MTASGGSLPRAYLDWNATTPLHPAARAAMIEAMDVLGNPSSIHAEGRVARKIIEDARANVALLVTGDAANAENVVFTSGATEAANALLGSGLSGCCGLEIAVGLRCIVSAVEHAAVLQAAGPQAEILPVLASGIVDLAALRDSLSRRGPALVSIQAANGETGIVQPIAEIAALVHELGGALVCDAVQWPGKASDGVNATGFSGFIPDVAKAVDALFISAHKFGGPKGVGAIVFRDSRTRLAQAYIAGGGQERGQRGGTENVPGIAGMGAAIPPVLDDYDALFRMKTLRDSFESRLKALAPGVRIVGEESPRLMNTTCFAIPGLTPERALIAFDLDGIAVSSGSACSSGKVKASHVLAAMGEADWVQAGAIRVSIGPTTTEDELERCLASLARQLARRPKGMNAA